MPTLFEQIAQQVAELQGDRRGPVQRGGLGYSGWDPLTKQGNFGTQFTGAGQVAANAPGGYPAAPYSPYPGNQGFQMLDRQVPGQQSLFQQVTPKTSTAIVPVDPEGLAARTAGTGPTPPRYTSAPQASGLNAFLADTLGAKAPEVGTLRGARPLGAGRDILNGVLARNPETGAIGKMGTAKNMAGNFFKVGLPITLGGNVVMNATGSQDRIMAGESNVLDQILSGAKTGGELGSPFGWAGAGVGAAGAAIGNPVANLISEDPVDIQNVVAKIPLAGAFLAPGATQRNAAIESGNATFDQLKAQGYNDTQANLAATLIANGKVSEENPLTPDRIAKAQQQAAEAYGDPGYLEGIENLDPTNAATQAQVAMGFGYDPADVTQRQNVFTQLTGIGLAPSTAFKVAFAGTPIYEQVAASVAGADPQAIAAATEQFMAPYIERMREGSYNMQGSLGESQRQIADAYGLAAQMGAQQTSQDALNEAFVAPADYLSYLLGQQKMEAEAVPQDVLLQAAAQG